VLEAINERLAGLEKKFDSRMEQIDSEMAMIHPSSNPWSFMNGSTSAITSEERDKFRRELISYYGADRDGGIICMVSGKVLDRSAIRAAHIWPAHARGAIVERWFNLDRNALDSARNGILMATAFEQRFDELRISFQWDDNIDKFRCVVLDKRLWNDNVPGLTDENGNPLPFSKIDRMELTTPSGKLPFRRLLAYHYAAALQKAVAHQWIGSQSVPDLFSADEKVRAWLQGKSPDAKWPGLPSYHRHLIAGSGSGKTSSRSKGASSSNAASVENAGGK
jgi:hypothetical protein